MATKEDLKRMAKENAEEAAKVKAYLDQVFAPLTPEEQVFFIDGVWGFFNPRTHSDDLFDSKEEALAAVIESDKAMLQRLQRAEDEFLVLLDQVIELVEEIQAEQEIAA